MSARRVTYTDPTAAAQPDTADARARRRATQQRLDELLGRRRAATAEDGDRVVDFEADGSAGEPEPHSEEALRAERPPHYGGD